MKRGKILFAGIALGFFLSLWGMDPAGAQPFGISQQQAPLKPSAGKLSSPVGRFVFGQVSDSAKDKFMLDTTTGRLWRISESGEVGIFLTPVPYRTKEGKCISTPEKAPASKKDLSGHQAKE
ncbi:MAG: hypothetical protein WAL98_06925 [Desulfatiglandaceae bacterium]|jgi:hypothetical protein